MLLSLLLAAALSVAAYFLWAIIHEMSHVWMAKRLVGLRWYKLKLYPHLHKGGLRWASVEYMPASKRTNDDIAEISMAPRIPDLFACLLLPLGALFLSGIGLQIWIIFLGGGLVDLIWGSLGFGKDSDIQVAAKASGRTPSAARQAGLFIATVTIVTTAFFLLL